MTHGNYTILNADDDNRIALKPIPEAEDCQKDYINACYVDVSYNILLVLGNNKYTT